MKDIMFRKKIFILSLLLVVLLKGISYSEDSLRVPVGIENDRVIDKNLKQIVNFLSSGDKLPEAQTDVLILCGNDDIKVIEEAANIYKTGLTNKILVSGYRARLLELLLNNANKNGYKIKGNLENITEAEIMKQILLKNGVSEDSIIVEDRENNTNTKVNIDHAKARFRKDNIKHDTIILMQKPLQQKRTELTFRKIFEEEIGSGKVNFISYSAYKPNIHAMSREEINYVLELCIDEFKRFDLYGSKGKNHLVDPKIPKNILSSYNKIYFFQKQYIEKIVKQNNLSYVMVKPDGIGELEFIKNKLNDKGINIIYEGKPITFTESQAKEFYAEHDGKPFFPYLVNYVTGNLPQLKGKTLIPMIVKAPNDVKDAVQYVRDVLGPTNGLWDEKSQKNPAWNSEDDIKNTIRGALMKEEDREGQPVTNRIHGSDSIESVVREAGIVIGEDVLKKVIIYFMANKNNLGEVNEKVFTNI